MEQLSAQDASFLYMEDNEVVANITAAYICDQSTAPDGLVRFKDILALVEDRLSHSPIYRRRLYRVPFEADFPYWADDPHFELEYHVQHARLPEPADWRQFCIHLARYHSRPLDLTRPLWQLYVLEGLDNIEGIPKGAFAMLWKMHHAAVDGTSSQEFLGACMDLGPKGPPVLMKKKKDDPKPLARPNLGKVAARAYWNNLRSPVRLSGAVLRQAPTLYKGLLKAAKSGFSLGGNIPMTRFNGDVSPHKAFDAAVFDLKDIQEIKAGVSKAKVNDVVLAICSGALHHYLKAHDELPERSMIANVPINLRQTDKDFRHRVSDGNNISSMGVALQTHIANPLERLKAIVRATQNSKAARDGMAARLMTDMTRHIPAATQAVAGKLIFQSSALGHALFNVFISNVPGPQIPFYMAGAKVLRMFGQAPLSRGMGLFITVPSYNGKISFNVTTTRDIVPDMPFFMECFEKSFAELQRAARLRLAEQENAKANVQADAADNVVTMPRKPQVRGPMTRRPASPAPAQPAKKAPAKSGPRAVSTTSPPPSPTKKPTSRRKAPAAKQNQSTKA